MSTAIPQGVLGEQLGDAIGGRRVRAAVFTTFSFDPGFFELEILPALFDKPFSQAEKVRRLQLEEALRGPRVAVYYDRSALSQDAMPAQLDFERIDVSRGPSKGVFHPKLALLLVERGGAKPAEEDVEAGEDVEEALVVGSFSANLTRAGWWENVEAGHFEEILDAERATKPRAFRGDLFGMIHRIRRLAAGDEAHEALDRVHSFLRDRTRRDAPAYHRSQRRHHTRLYAGQERLDEWLGELRIPRGMNLEVVSPYFDSTDATALKRLVQALEPRETRVHLPRGDDGSALVAGDLYEAVAGVARWAELPAAVLEPGGRKRARGEPTRSVHAKVYRLWNSKEGKQLTLVGSVNLTTAAHSPSSAGNLEAAFFADVTDDGIPARWWLQPIDAEPERFAEEAAAGTEDLAGEPVPIELSLAYDWAAGIFAYRVAGGAEGPITLEALTGEALERIERPVADAWTPCSATAAERLAELLRSTSFVRARHPRGEWRVLVREASMSHRPSVLTELTAEEILMYWSLLSPAQKEAFLAQKLAAQGELDEQGLKIASRLEPTRDTVFDRFAGIYHAFEQLRQQVHDALYGGDDREAEARLFGAKYDSLPHLLEKSWAEGEDPIIRYVVFLCAKQLADEIERAHPEFWPEEPSRRGALDAWLARLPEVEEALPLEGEDRATFLDWYRSMFLRPARAPANSA